MGVTDQRIEALAARQFSVFATWQLPRIGVQSRAVLPRERDGRLRRLFHGVYSTAPYPPVRGRLMAAALACGPRAMLGHRPAGLVFDITDWKGGPVDVTVPHGTRSRRGIRAHRAKLLPQDRTFIDGIPVTSLARTLLDLAAVLPAKGLQRAYERAEQLEILDLTSLSELLARSNGHKGAKPLTALLAYDPTAAANTLSELERIFLDLLRAHDVPLPQANVLVDGFLVDCYWPDADLVVELDGYEFHSDRETFESDRRKLATLRRNGREAIALTHRQITQDAGWVVATVSDLLRLGFAAACRS